MNKYYFKEQKNLKNNISNKLSEYDLISMRGIFAFFNASLNRCRSPPLFNLSKKNKLNGGKKEWQIAQKGENIRIILIH